MNGLLSAAAVLVTENVQRSAASHACENIEPSG